MRNEWPPLPTKYLYFYPYTLYLILHHFSAVDSDISHTLIAKIVYMQLN